MKIVVTADTHLNEGGKVPSRLKHELETAELIIHAGDWKSMDVYTDLSKYGEVKGVYGNVDDEDIQEHLPAKEILNLSNFKIGIVHGHGNKKTTEKRAIEAFAGDNADVIISGHSHIPMIRYFKSALLLNPGSPTDKRTLPYYSFAILELDEDIRADIIFFNDKT